MCIYREMRSGEWTWSYFLPVFALPYVRKKRQMASALALVSIVVECYKREEYLLVKMSMKIRQIESKLF